MTDVPIPFEPILRRIGAVADELRLETYAIGGAVRDALLRRATTDLEDAPKAMGERVLAKGGWTGGKHVG